MERLENNKSRSVWSFVGPQWHDITCRCIQKFFKKCIKSYELDLVYFLLAPGLVYQVCLKKTVIELKLLTGIDMLLMVEKGITVEHVMQSINTIKQLIHKNHNKDKKTSYFL